MKRRGFVGAASAALAVTLWPGLVQRAFGDEACEGSPLGRIAQVAASFRRARASGKALLVLVIPAENADRWTRGQVFGELINHGSDRNLAPLSAVEVVCATMEDLRKLVPGAGTGEPLMVLVRPDQVPATARQLDTSLSARVLPGDGSRRLHEQQEDAVSDQRIAAMGDLLRRSLGDFDKGTAALAAEVRARLKDKAPAGTRWARSEGCGVNIEGDEPMAIGCGMGHVPRKAQRFLYFYSRHGR